MSSATCFLSTRGSDGIQMCHGPPLYRRYDPFPNETNHCRTMAFSQDGKHFVWCNGQNVTVVALPSCQQMFQAKKPRTGYIVLSPKGSIVAAWEPYATRDGHAGSPNMHVWSVKTGECLKTFFQKKNAGWEPQWSSDEEICSRIVNNEVHFFHKNDFGTIVKKLFLQKVNDFSLSPGPPPYHVACYSVGTKGQPSFVRLFCYPKFEGNSATIANKSFFKADKVDFHWNRTGSGLLILTSTDVDKSGSSYYGEQKLHYLATNGDTAQVTLAKDGPVYSIEWNPNCAQFCVVYGFMPAKATLFNLKCEAIFDFGTGHRNLVYYNIHGNLLILAGFGNLQGNIEVWDLKKLAKVNQLQAPNSTNLEWSPDGQHFLTCTTSPRLRVGNGYKIWHYTGSLLNERNWPENQELWEVAWQPHPPGTFPERPVQYTPVSGGIQPSQPQASKEVYRPPGARGQPPLHKIPDRYERPSNARPGMNQDDQAPNKNRKKKEAKRRKKGMTQENDETATKKATDELNLISNHIHVSLTGDPEKNKKIRNVLKKLDQIAKLKDQMDEGKVLEANQVEKIKKEEELLSELENLQIS